uniref:Uncharacterized protein n=1 Tax=Glossina pallidipes TaxID=7398 RepID=A0A1A9Z2I5_GLOPL
MFASSSSTRSADRKHSIYDKRRMTFKAVLIYFFLILLHDCDGYVVAKITNGSVDATVSVVPTVHTRVTYLGFLIGSLGQSSDIGKVLLIFSHDYYDADINDLVKSIRFCRVVQIFYPYPVHWHPKCPQDTEESS